jgi:ABC-2 type transport system permease protein
VSAIVHTGLLTGRQLRAFVRQPAYLVMNIIQPLIWLLLFGQLFSSVVDIPGFTGGSDYLTFLTPGIVMMMALFSSAWAGTTFIEDMKTGVMSRFLTSPTSRGGLVVATMFYQAVLTVMQTLIVLGVATAMGVRFASGFAGIVVLLGAAVLLTFVFSAFSNAIALMAREQTALIGVSQLVSFPLMFLSSAIMDTTLSPAWVRSVARFNPFEWAVAAGREVLGATPAWGEVLLKLGMLAALSVVMAWLATSAFRSYRRSA